MKGKGTVMVALAAVCCLLLAGAAQAQAPAAKNVVIGFTASQTGKLNVEGMRQINGLNLWMERSTPPAASNWQTAPW